MKEPHLVRIVATCEYCIQLQHKYIAHIYRQLLAIGLTALYIE